MAVSEQQRIMDSLIDQGPEAWRNYLRPFEEGAPLGGISMLVIFHHAAPLAKTRDNLEWADVAVRAAELEARNCKNPVERENVLRSAMSLRSWFICRRGSRSGHQVLDKSIILNWAKEDLSAPIQATRDKAAWLDEKMPQVRVFSQEEKQQFAGALSELRRLKQRLNVLKMLADCGELAIDPALDEWLELRERLP